MSELKLSKTINTIFMVPTLKIDKDARDANGFLNGYAKDATKEEHYEDACYLLYKPKNIDRFREFIDSERERTDGIIDEYDLPNKFVVVVYKLDPKFKADFDLIRESKYSKTSPEFQVLFPKVIHLKVNGLARDELSLQTRIFKKTEDLKSMWEDRFQEDLMDHVEYWEGYHEERETLTNEKLEEYLKKEEELV